MTILSKIGLSRMVIFGVALALSMACLSSISGWVASGSTQRKPDDKASTQKSGQSASEKTKNSSGQSTDNPGPELPVRQTQNENPVLEDLRIRAWSPKRFDQPDEAIRFYLNKRLPEGVTDFPIEKYFEAQELIKGMPQFSTVTNSQYPSQLQMRVSGTNQNIGTWSPLGPGNIGGRTRAILIDPQNTNLIYAAGVAGGVWKSSNGGQTWTPQVGSDSQHRRHFDGLRPAEFKHHLCRHRRGLFQCGWRPWRRDFQVD
ncbi:MAG: hypothetical protein IPJ07_01400 [Acidobacteria bacterium]|nr:hypothetical protein [Acidobacteriota bacterium]